MARLFRTIGRLAGYAARTQAIDKALSKTADFLQTEIRLADIKLKLGVLHRKRQNHLKPHRRSPRNKHADRRTQRNTLRAVVHM